MSLLEYLKPPRPWIIPVNALVFIMLCSIVYLFFTSKAVSYLADEPETCINCHVMIPQYSTWYHSAHREVAVCNDCHIPHNSLPNKYFFKAKDGIRHATVFSLRNEPQVIFIKEEGEKAVQQNCIRCHEFLITDDLINSLGNDNQHYRQARLCWECHRQTPHGRVNSLSSTPNARIPMNENPVQEWIMKKIKSED